MSTLVTYFSASGNTAKVANDFAKSIDADIFEIVPEEPYNKVYAFATSGGSGIGKTAEKLAAVTKGAEEVDAILVRSAAQLKDWK